MCITERDFVVPSLYGIIYSQRSNEGKKRVFTKANKENKLTEERIWNIVKEANSSSEDDIFAYL